MRWRISSLLAVFFIALSACSSRPVISSDAGNRDSLSLAAEHELVRGSLQVAKGDYQGAVDCYQKLLLAQPSNAALHYALSKAYLGLGVADSARLHSEKSVSSVPGNKYYLRQLATISHRMHDYKRSVDMFRQLVALQPGNVELLSALALEYIAAEQPEQALAVFQEIVKLDPADRTIGHQILFLQVKLSRYNEAITTLTTLIEKDNGGEKLRMLLAELYQKSGQYDLSAKTFRQIVEDNHRFLPAWIGLLEVSSESGHQELFFDNLHRFYTTSESTVEQKIGIAGFFAARAARNSSFAEPAAAMIAGMKRQYPVNSKAILMVEIVEGDLLYNTGKYREAVTLLERIIHLKKIQQQKLLYLQASSILALCYDILGNPEKSIMLYEQVLAMDSENILVTNNLAYMLACQGKELDRAKTLAMKAVAAEPLNAGYLDTLGWTLYRMGNYQQAKEILEKAAGLNLQESDIADHLGQVYEKLGNREKALEMKEKVQKLKTGKSPVASP